VTTPVSFRRCTAQGLVLGELDPSRPFPPPCKSSALLGTHLRRAPAKKRNHSGISPISQEGGRVREGRNLPALQKLSLLPSATDGHSESDSGCYWKGTVLARSTTVLTTEPQRRKMQYEVCSLLFSLTAVATEAR